MRAVLAATALLLAAAAGPQVAPCVAELSLHSKLQLPALAANHSVHAIAADSQVKPYLHVATGPNTPWNDGSAPGPKNTITIHTFTDPTTGKEPTVTNSTSINARGAAMLFPVNWLYDSGCPFQDTPSSTNCRYLGVLTSYGEDFAMGASFTLLNVTDGVHEEMCYGEWDDVAVRAPFLGASRSGIYFSNHSLAGGTPEVMAIGFWTCELHSFKGAAALPPNYYMAAASTHQAETWFDRSPDTEGYIYAEDHPLVEPFGINVRVGPATPGAGRALLAKEPSDAAEQRSYWAAVRASTSVTPGVRLATRAVAQPFPVPPPGALKVLNTADMSYPAYYHASYVAAASPPLFVGPAVTNVPGVAIFEQTFGGVRIMDTEYDNLTSHFNLANIGNGGAPKAVAPVAGLGWLAGLEQGGPATSTPRVCKVAFVTAGQVGAGTDYYVDDVVTLPGGCPWPVPQSTVFSQQVQAVAGAQNPPPGVSPKFGTGSAFVLGTAYGDAAPFVYRLSATLFAPDPRPIE